MLGYRQTIFVALAEKGGNDPDEGDGSVGVRHA